MSTSPDQQSEQQGGVVVQDLSDSFPRDRRGKPRFALLLHNVYTAAECRHLIEMSESHGYEPALVNVGGGRQELHPDVRNSDRAIIFDPTFAESLYQRILSGLKQGQGTAKAEEDQLITRLLHAPWVPLWKPPKHYTAVGCNERLSFLRYGPGQYFAPHRDGCFRRPSGSGPRAGEVSHVTVQLYLNDDFCGGQTRFQRRFDDDSKKNKWGGRNIDNVLVDVVPRTGSVLLFEHGLLHQGCMITEGRKYAMRTDVMYTDGGPGHEYCRGEPPVCADEGAVETS